MIIFTIHPNQNLLIKLQLTRKIKQNCYPEKYKDNKELKSKIQSQNTNESHNIIIIMSAQIIQSQSMKHQRNNNYKMNTFQITSQLDHIYPDINGELCSKHTTLLNQINTAFQKTYPTHTATHYVIAKAVTNIYKSELTTISMALEQGVTIILSPTQEGDQLYFEGNVFTQDLILQSSGKSVNSQKDTLLSEQISNVIGLALQDLSLNRTRGGVLYIHCHDVLDKLGLKDSLLIGIFMAILQINDLLGQYGIQQLIARLRDSNIFQDNSKIQSYFNGYKNRYLLFQGKQHSQIQLQSKYKPIFMSLSFISQAADNKPLDNCEDMANVVEQFINKEIDIVALFNQLNTNLSLNYDQKIQTFVEQVKNQLKIKASLFIKDGYCIFLVQNYRYAEIIGKISNQIRKLLSSQSNQQSPILSNRHSATNISTLIFSSVPSQALSILDPSHSMWF